MSLILPIVLFVLYTASAWSMLRSVTKPRLEPLAWVLLLVAIIAHSDDIARTMRLHGTFAIGLLEAISMLAWTLAVLAGILCLEQQNRALGAILIASAAAGSAVTGSGHIYDQDSERGWDLTAHILLSMGAAALLFAAAVTALLLVFLDRRLRSRRIADLPKVLPPLDALERVMFRLIAAGFVLLTLSLLTGFVFITDLFAQHLQHKTILSIVAWVIFAVLLLGRWRFGWRGRAAVWWTLSGFGMLASRVFRFEVRARVRVRAALGLSPTPMTHQSLGADVRRAFSRLLVLAAFFRRQRNRADAPEPLSTQTSRKLG